MNTKSGNFLSAVESEVLAAAVQIEIACIFVPRPIN
jgi:hypothetical protein